MKSEIHHADKILELMYKIITRNDADLWPMTGHIKVIPVQPPGLMDKT